MKCEACGKEDAYIEDKTDGGIHWFCNAECKAKFEGREPDDRWPHC